MVNNTVTSPKGFLGAGVHCGIKQSGKPDLGMIVCPTGATAAAVFTTNKIVSAGVIVSREHVKSRKVYAVVVNSGNANACTGQRGIENAVSMCARTAESLSKAHGTRLPRSARNDGAKVIPLCAARNILVASTGIIGHPLPMDKITIGIEKAAKALAASAGAGLDFARAIMTTDMRPKQATQRVRVGGAKVTIAAAVKGAGMIAPNMATTLLFLTTDIAISKALLHRALKEAVGLSLNRLTVDGHQSTNDTGIVLASGLAGNRTIHNQGPPYRKFLAALVEVCDDLARQMAFDAEGATRIFKVVVKGAATRAEAARACRAVAEYPLVKCAVHGGDPNWGRIICAVGSCGVRLNPARLTCRLDRLVVFRNGAPAKFNMKEASRIVSQPEHRITVELGLGRESSFCYGCDLGRGYVEINADYHT